jgi:hypothetical protein
MRSGLQGSSVSWLVGKIGLQETRLEKWKRSRERKISGRLRREVR